MAGATTKQPRLFVGDFDSINLKQHNALQKLITDHPLNYEVEVVYPGNTENNLTLAPTHYWQGETQLLTFIQKDFLSNVLRKGNFYAVSVDRRIDVGDSFAITVKGHLILSLCKDTYERAGLVGHHVHYARTESRYVVDIDLLMDAFAPDHKIYERVLWSFQTILNQSFRWFGVFDGPVDSQEWLSHQNKIHRANIARNTEVFEELLIPAMNPSLSSKDLLALEIYDWLGLVACRATKSLGEGTMGQYISTYEVPAPNNSGQLVAVRYTGMISPRSIIQLLDDARKLVSNTSPWVALTVWGFIDAPSSWQTHEHGFLTQGDNHFTILLLPNDHQIAFQAIGAYDALS